MAYSTRELSTIDGEPIELYTFQAPGQTWNYNNSDSDVTVGGATYKSINIKRLDIEQTPDKARSPQTLTLPGANVFVGQYAASPPNFVVRVTIKRHHRGDTDVATIWLGRVVNVKFMADGFEAEVRCEPVYTSILRPVLRRLYQRNCSHVLFGVECRLSRTAYEEDISLQGVNGTVLSAGEFALKADGYYGGGYVQWTSGTEIQRRFIVSHSSFDITVSLPFVGLPGNASIKVYPGCDHTLDTCVTTFSNELNYGGQPYFPDKNPFGQSPVF